MEFHKQIRFRCLHEFQGNGIFIVLILKNYSRGKRVISHLKLIFVHQKHKKRFN